MARRHRPCDSRTSRKLQLLFPFYGETLYIVPPRNVWPPPASPKVRFKGARFVPLKVVETLISGRPIAEENWAIDGASECLISGGAQGPFRVNVRSNAAVDRNGESVAPHSTACLEFTPGGGLWFIASFADAAAKERWSGPLEGPRACSPIADSVEDAPEAGAVPKCPRSSKAICLRLLLNPSEDADGYWLLSVFHPAASDSIDWQHGNYSLSTRGGRIESHGDEKKPTRMLTEGSVIVSASAPVGAVSDVAPENFAHPVYRSGFALAIPVPLIPAARPA